MDLFVSGRWGHNGTCIEMNRVKSGGLAVVPVTYQMVMSGLHFYGSCALLQNVVSFKVELKRLLSLVTV